MSVSIFMPEILALRKGSQSCRRPCLARGTARIDEWVCACNPVTFAVEVSHIHHSEKTQCKAKKSKHG
jgi:hypothetical protein